MRGDKRERIIRVMLASREELSKSEISKMAGCTRQWVILFLKEMRRKKIADGTCPNRKKLLEYWMRTPRKPKKFREYMVKEPLELLKKTRMDYALTTYQAENIVQHYLFPARTDIYIDKSDLAEWHGLMTKKGLYGKGNVRILIADRHVMFGKKKINNLWIVSLPQIIIDLMEEGGPGQEAAEMLMKRV